MPPTNPVPSEAIIRRSSDADGGGALAVHRLNWTNPARMDEDQLLAFVTKQYDCGKARRFDWERDAALQLAWVRGNQNLIWSGEGDGAKLEPEMMAELPMQCRDPIILNKLRGFLLDAIGLVLGKPMSWEVFPATRENDDVTSAKAQAKLLRNFWGACSPSGQVKLLEGFWFMFCTGIVWAKATWDPFAGDSRHFDAEMMREGDEKDDEPTRGKWKDRLRGMIGKKRELKPEEVQLDGDGVELPEGDIALDFVSGFDVTEPEHCHLAEEAPWMIVSRFRSIEYLRQRYGEEVRDLEADSAETLQKHHGYEFPGGSLGRTGDQAGGFAESTEVLVHELWRPRTPKICPRGFCGLFTSSRVLKKGPNPYIHGQIPLTTFREHGEPEAFRPNSTIHDLMGLQRARNKQRSYLHAHLNMAINPRILHEPQAGLPEDAFTTGPQKILVKDGGIAGVRAFEYPNAPPYVERLDQMNDRDMEDVGRVHRSTAGRQESATQSGKHAQLMLQGDERGKTATKILIQSSAARLGAQMLALVWQYYTEERSIQITGERGASEVLTFKGRSLIAKPPIGPDAANIRAVLGEQQSMEDVVAKIEGLTKLGYLSAEREEDRRMVMRWINERVPAETDEDSEHRTNAAMENELLMGSAADKKRVRVAWGDNDAVHIREHEMLTTTGRYKEAVAKDPLIDVAWLLHLHEHLFSRMLKEMYPESLRQQVAEYIKKLQPPAPPQGMPAGVPSGVPPGIPPGMQPPIGPIGQTGYPGMAPPGGPILPPGNERMMPPPPGAVPMPGMSPVGVGP